MNASRDRLRNLTVKLITDTDKLHKELIEFIWFVDHVNELVDRRSKKLQNALPDNPVAKSEALARDERMRSELNRTVQMIRDAFPSLTGSIPPPRKAPIHTSGQMPEIDEIEVLELKQEAEKITEYQSKKQPKATILKH